MFQAYKTFCNIKIDIGVMYKMKLGTRIGLGFGILILIACVLGAVAVWNMKRVGSQSIVLSSEFIPEVEVSQQYRAQHAALDVCHERVRLEHELVILR